MTLEKISTSFQYTASSTSDIVLSGWGFQPKAIILTWTGVASATDSVSAGTIYVGKGFGTGVSDQRSAGYTSTNGSAGGAGATCRP